MCHLSSFSSLKSLSRAHVALSEAREGSQHTLTQEGGCLPSFRPCPRTLTTQSWEAETLYRSSGPPVCKFHRSSELWGGLEAHRESGSVSFLQPAVPKIQSLWPPWIPLTMPRMRPVGLCPHCWMEKRSRHATASTLFSHTYCWADGWSEATRICLSLVHVYCVSTACKVLDWS